MIEAVLGLVPVYGLAVVFLVTFTGCLGLPVPGSLALLAAGSFSASGDLVPAAAIAAGLAGALRGDRVVGVAAIADGFVRLLCAASVVISCSRAGVAWARKDVVQVRRAKSRAVRCADQHAPERAEFDAAVEGEFADVPTRETKAIVPGGG